jgi:hypothetical protein
MSEIKRCCSTVRTGGGFNRHQCTRNAKVERDGKPYCGSHDPVLMREKANKRFDDWKAKNDTRISLDKRFRHKAACFDVLVAALEMQISAFSGDAIDEIEMEYGLGTAQRVDAARAAIAKAKGEA